MKPVCVPCQRFFRVKRNGYVFIEGMPKDNDARPGTVDAASWQPYKIWNGDLWECQGCGAQIVSGVGHEPIRVQHEADFEHVRTLYDADQLQVNDC